MRTVPSILRLARIIGTATICMWLMGCGKPVDELTTLTWKGYDGKTERDTAKAIYVLNGQDIGAGEAGFEEVLSMLEKRSRGGRLYVFPDEAVLNLLTGQGSGPAMPHPNTVPFRESRDLYDAFRKVARERGVAVWYLAGPPGTWVSTTTGEDLKVRGE